jgi:hypothetical protein
MVFKHVGYTSSLISHLNRMRDRETPGLKNNHSGRERELGTRAVQWEESGARRTRTGGVGTSVLARVSAWAAAAAIISCQRRCCGGLWEPPRPARWERGLSPFPSPFSSGRRETGKSRGGWLGALRVRREGAATASRAAGSRRRAFLARSR